MPFFRKAMAAAGGARRALAGLRCASRPPIAGTFSRQGAAQSPAFAAAASLPRALRRCVAFASPPGERACLLFLVPLRGASSFASEQIGGEYHHELGARCGRDYGESHSKHPTSHPNHQLQPDLPSAGSSTGVDRKQCIDAGVNVNAQHSYNLEQPYRSGRSHGFPNSHQLYTDARANSGKPGSNVRQLYGSGSAYGQQSPSGDLPSGHQQYNGVQANNWLSGYGKGQTHHEPNGYGIYNSGFKIPSNQQSYDGERATYGQYGYSSSGQSYQRTTRNDQLVFQRQKAIDQKHDGIYPNIPGNSVSQYANPSGFYKEYVAGFQQGPNGNYGYNAPQAYHSPHVNNQVDAQSNHQGYSMKFNTTDGIYQEKRSGFQPTASNGNNLNGGPYQDGSSTEVSHETSVFGKCKGTVEELDKLCEDGKVKEAPEVLALLQEKGIVVDAPRYFKLMQVCGDAAALAEARIIHNKVTHSALDVNTDVNNKILEMYARCGSMEDAKKLFSVMGQQNLTSWNTMISGFVNNGLGEEAIDFFHQFKQTRDKPDSGMFVHVFLACGILGSVDEGMLHFESMQKDFGITPTMEHYVSIVNMLGQSGYIDEAREFVEWMPVEPSIDVWETLMNMCRLNGFSKLGDRCAQIIECLGARLNEQSKMGLFPVNASDLAKEKERKKANAVEVRSKIHEYRAGDRSHPEHPKIYEELRCLAAHMKEAGYIADTRFVLHDVDHETKEDALLAHSERLAVGYGLITSAARSPIRVIKNLRSCGDCHTALKIISKLVGRQIIARDAKRFHHFENGLCSCKDYW